MANRINPLMTFFDRISATGKTLTYEAAFRIILALLQFLTRNHTDERLAKDLRRSVNTLREEIDQNEEKVVRLAKTGWVLTRITFSYLSWDKRSKLIKEDKRGQVLNRIHQKDADLFKRISLKHGGAFLKIGQLLSSRADILPEVWISELKVLQDQARTESFETIQACIRKELNGEIDDFFIEFNAEPLAAASIGQVHKAKLKCGTEVALKIQRPNLESTIKTDLALMKLFIYTLAPLLPATDLTTITQEIERAVIEELDYTQEAAWMAKIGEFLEPVEGIRVPRLFPQHSTGTIICSEFIAGRNLAHALDEKLERGDKESISNILGRLFDCYMRQALTAGFFQADPHPGNILVTESDDLVLLDFGCSVQFTEKFKSGYRKVLSYAMMKQKDKLGEELINLGFRTKSGKPDTLILFSDTFLEVILATIQQSQTGEAGESLWPSADDIIQQAQGLAESLDHDPVTVIPPEIIMLARVFATLDGLFSHYKPTIDAGKYILPHIMGSMVSPEPTTA